MVVCTLFFTCGVPTLPAQVQATLEGHTAWVASVAISPCGKMVASGDGDGEIRLWDLRSCELKATLSGHSSVVECLAFSPNGSLLASGGRDNTVRIWSTDAAEKKLTFTAHAGDVNCIRFSPDGKMVASGSDDDTIALWDPANGSVTSKLRRSSDVRSLAFCSDGKKLAIASDDGTLTLWDFKNDFERAQLTGLARNPSCASLSEDGSLLAIATDEMSVELWDVATRQRRFTFEGHKGPVLSMQFAPDNSLLATGAGTIFRLEGAFDLFPFRAKSANVEMKKEYAIRIWATNGGSELATMKGHKSSVRGLAFLADGNMLASASTDKSVKLWDLAKRLRTRVDN
jgi:WD40 repeat protein